MKVRVFCNDDTDFIIENITGMLFDFNCLEISTLNGILVFEKKDVSHVEVYENE